MDVLVDSPGRLAAASVGLNASSRVDPAQGMARLGTTVALLIIVVAIAVGVIALSGT
jgi:hypothetical protein